MQVRDVMTKQPHYLDADASIREVAQTMSERNTGFEPLVKDDRVTGVVTDRDLALRAYADNRSLDEKVSAIASDKVLYTYESEDVDHVLENMIDQHVQRLLVLNDPEKKDLSGIVSLGDIANHCEDDQLARKLVSCARHYQ
ncbi:CBS domain-containing protein [Marinobacter sp. OP 3.4]|uniref:CBS domain-containing protein n=1 Tax=Marinobacter sp. OP 3.4 TaxID=3076501 RepID=UPI002E237975